MDHAIYLATLVGTGLVLVAAFSSLIAFRFGAPLLLLFLSIGLLAGNDGLGVRFDNAAFAYFAGSLALAEEGAADAHVRRPLLDRHLEIPAHAHGQILEPQPRVARPRLLGHLAEPAEPGARPLRALVQRRQQHQPAHLDPLALPRRVEHRLVAGDVGL